MQQRATTMKRHSAGQRTADLPLHRQQKRRGAAIVETAVTLPIFVLVVFGIVEFGRAMMVSQLLTNAAREGARKAVLTGSTNSEVETVVKDFLVSTLGISSGDITVTITITPEPGNPDPGNQLSSANTRDLCDIQVQVPFDKVSLTPGQFLMGKNLVGQCAMRRE